MRSLLTAAGLANEIRMARRNGEARAILLVEGRSDHKFYTHHIDNSKCALYGREGKDIVIECIKILNGDVKTSGYLGIVDLDFDIILAKKQEVNNLIYVLDGDLERMLLTSNVIKKLNIEFCDESLTLGKEEKILEAVLFEASKIGLYRLASAKCEMKYSSNPFRMKFEGMDIGSTMDKADSINIDYDMLEDEIMRNSRRTIDFDRVMQEANLDADLEWDVREMSQGHDIMEIYSRGIERLWGSKVINPNTLVSSARIAYSPIDFMKTNVFNEIKDWELANRPYIIL